MFGRFQDTLEGYVSYVETPFTIYVMELDVGYARDAMISNLFGTWDYIIMIMMMTCAVGSSP